MGDAADEHERIMMNMMDEDGFGRGYYGGSDPMFERDFFAPNPSPRKPLTDAEAQALFDATR